MLADLSFYHHVHAQLSFRPLQTLLKRRVIMFFGFKPLFSLLVLFI
jgi:hypothetical protein